MGTVTVDAAISLLLALINNASQISALIQEAKTNGSNTINADQWSGILAADDLARKQLSDLASPSGS